MIYELLLIDRVEGWAGGIVYYYPFVLTPLVRVGVLLSRKQ